MSRERAEGIAKGCTHIHDDDGIPAWQAACVDCITAALAASPATTAREAQLLGEIQRTIAERDRAYADCAALHQRIRVTATPPGPEAERMAYCACGDAKVSYIHDPANDLFKHHYRKPADFTNAVTPPPTPTLSLPEAQGMAMEMHKRIGELEKALRTFERKAAYWEEMYRAGYPMPPVPLPDMYLRIWGLEKALRAFMEWWDGREIPFTYDQVRGMAVAALTHASPREAS